MSRAILCACVAALSASGCATTASGQCARVASGASDAQLASLYQRYRRPLLLTDARDAYLCSCGPAAQPEEPTRHLGGDVQQQPQRQLGGDVQEQPQRHLGGDVQEQPAAPQRHLGGDVQQQPARTLGGDTQAMPAASGPSCKVNESSCGGFEVDGLGPYSIYDGRTGATQRCGGR